MAARSVALGAVVAGICAVAPGMASPAGASPARRADARASLLPLTARSFGLGGSRALASPLRDAGSAAATQPHTATGIPVAVFAVSCAAPGDCSAGGSYTYGSDVEAFTADETDGTWGDAEEVPGTASLNAGGNAEVDALSCTSPGNCSATGSYLDGDFTLQAFVVDETDGVWGDAEEVPGLATLNVEGNATPVSISCASPGNCSAGGSYIDGSFDSQAFVVDESEGVWGDAQEVPGTAGLNAGGDALVTSVSCTSAGSCSAAGFYNDDNAAAQAFVDDETEGTWGDAQEVPGTADLNAGGNAGANSISCASPGNCSTGGYYTDDFGDNQAFVDDESDGVWGQAQEVPGTAGLNADGTASAFAISCASAGNCGVGGFYTDSSGEMQAFVASETAGAWGEAEEVPGTAGLNAGAFAFVGSISCPSAGSCSVGGAVTNAFDTELPIVDDETDGSWENAEVVPGAASIDTQSATAVFSISCPSAGDCSAAGASTSSMGELESGFVDDETEGTWADAEALAYIPPPPTVTGLKPASGPASGGTIVAVDGSDLLEATAVDFGATAATIDEVESPTEIVVTAPKGVGTVDVTVTTPGGTSSVTQADQYTYVPAPAITKLSPSSGPIWGGTPVTISGSNLADPTAVRFGTVAATIDKVLSSSEIEVTAPKGSGAVAVTVTTVGGTSAATPADRYGYVVPYGYWLASAGGHVFGVGASVGRGGPAASTSDPVVGIAATPDGGGYFVVTRDGTVATFGDAENYGDLPARHVSVDDIVTIVATSDGKGYWLTGADGSVYIFGDARYYDDLPGLGVKVSDVVAMLATPGGTGYQLVGADGGVFAFGATHFYGSLPGLGVKVDDIRGILPSAADTGYVLVGADGGAFVFGTGVRFYGSLPGRGIKVDDIVGIALTADDLGYWMAGSNGAVYDFGDATPFPEPAGLQSSLPVTAIAGV